MNIKVTFEINLPDYDELSHQQITEWLEFNLYESGGIGIDNPLRPHSLEPIHDLTWRIEDV